MIEIPNVAKQRLEAGGLALGVGLRQARTVDIARAMKTAGFDWLFIDMEHNAMDVDMATQISVAAQDAGITPLVRVPGFEHHHASRVLDCGAQGIVVPHVDDAETAAQMVSNCRFPPLGHRSRGLVRRRRGRGRAVRGVQRRRSLWRHGLPQPLRTPHDRAATDRGRHPCRD